MPSASAVLIFATAGAEAIGVAAPEVGVNAATSSALTASTAIRVRTGIIRPPDMSEIGL
jgi:hypothetical protein